MTNDTSAVLSILTHHGKSLLRHFPAETTELVIDFVKGNLTGERPSNVEAFLPIFVNNSPELIKLLESLLKDTAKESNLMPVIVNTLIELYLNRFVDDGNSAWGDKVMQLLKQHHGCYEVERILVLLKRCSFRSGLLYLYAELSMYTEVARLLIDEENDDALLSYCQENGAKHHNLWLLALNRFSKSSTTHYLEKSLEALSQDESIPPLVILKILSQSGDVPLSVAKNFIVDLLKQSQQSISEDQSEIQRIKTNIKLMDDQVKNLSTKAKIFQGSKCHLCTQPLTLPTTHFLCSHSFHTNCLGDNDHRCPLCSEEQDRKLSMIKTGRLSTDEIQQFYKQLELTGFSAVSSFISRGVFSRRTENPIVQSPMVVEGEFEEEDDFLNFNSTMVDEQLDWEFQ
ncbi:hypothetical protein GEMRC1_007284 [Eukaryota sp. GEM-RC1]